MKPKHNKSKLRIYFLFILPFIVQWSYAQDSTIHISHRNIVKYRMGYIVDFSGDTIKGLINPECDDKILFIKKGIKIKPSLFGAFDTIPPISANSNEIKEFFRNGIYYQVIQIPPYGNFVFLAVLETGPLCLYALIYNYNDKRMADNSVNPGLLTSMFNESEVTEEEYYDIKAYYIKKSGVEQLMYIPKGEKKFRDVYIPLIKDNKNYVAALAGQEIDYYNLRYLVRLYNNQIIK